MLALKKKDAEAAQTHEIKRGGDSSILSKICGIVEPQITRALVFATTWIRIEGKIAVELNRDFFPPNFTSADFTAWVSARQAGESAKKHCTSSLSTANGSQKKGRLKKNRPRWRQMAGDWLNCGLNNYGFLK